MYWHTLSVVVVTAILSIAQCEIDCKYDQFACDGGTCIKASQRCDGVKNCVDGSDEKNCDTSYQYHVCDWERELQCPTSSGECVSKVGVCVLPGYPNWNDCTNKLDLVDCPCADNQVRCDDTQQCVAKAARCNADSNISVNVGCGANAPGCDYSEAVQNCPSGYFECMNLENTTAQCHPNSMMCDSEQDCAHNEETDCAGPKISFAKPDKYYIGETFTLVAKIYGKPQPKITLLKYDMPVYASERIIIDYPTSTDPRMTERDYTVTFKELGLDNIGSYKIFAENKGYIDGSEMRVDVTRYNTKVSKEINVQLAGRPEVTNLDVTDPDDADKAQNVSLLQGDSYTMKCNIYGYPQPKVTFFKDNVDITNNSRYFITSETNPAGANQTIWRLVIDSLVPWDYGSYKCHASNIVADHVYKIVNLDINIKRCEWCKEKREANGEIHIWDFNKEETVTGRCQEHECPTGQDRCLVTHYDNYNEAYHIILRTCGNKAIRDSGSICREVEDRYNDESYPEKDVKNCHTTFKGTRNINSE